ncbi:MAG: hypothetical protein PHV36_01425 [Elusimicrobiales bacterium]|nr:hypothetical protein [Elusimicrobiales bacterium]
MKKTILALSLFILGWTAPLSAEVMTYQGRLKESNIPVSANRIFIFEFCDAGTLGNCYTTPSGFQSFTVQNGLFKSTFAVPTSDLSQGQWFLQVSVGVNIPGIQILTPRERLTAVPYSVYSATAGYSPAAVQKTGDTMTGQLTLSGSSLTVTGAQGLWSAVNTFADNVAISSAAAGAYGGISVSTHVYLPAGAKFYGDGSGLINVAAASGTDSTKVLKTGDTMTGGLNLSASSITINADTATQPYALMTNGVYISTAGSILTMGTGNGTWAPNARGKGAVDLQTARNAATAVASGDYSFIGGGANNTASGKFAALAGGFGVSAVGDYSAVSGGVNNIANSAASSVGGGQDNGAYGGAATVGGGHFNLAGGGYSVISGGQYNTAAADKSAVGGGLYNVASGSNSVTSGGAYNIASGTSAVISGGEHNTASGMHASISGGSNNNAGGNYATVPGGTGNWATGVNSFAAGQSATSSAGNSFTWADSGNVTLDNSVSDRAVFKTKGGFIVTGSTQTAMTGTVDRGVFISGNGLVGISNGTPGAALDVLAAGNTGSEFAQIWRNSAGAIISSVSATGVMMSGKFIGDGSGLTGLTAGAAGTATNLAGGAIGAIPYQTSAGNTAMLAAGSLNYLLQGSGSAAPMWTNAPTISGAQITGIPAGSIVAGSLLNTVIASSLSVNSVYDGAMLNPKVNRNGDTMIGSLDVFGATLRVRADQSVPYSFAAGTGTIASHLYVSTSGNVGVGTTNPTTLLDVSRPAGTGNIVTFTGSQSSTTIDQWGNIDTQGANPTAGVAGTGIASIHIDNTGSKAWRIENTRTAAAGALEFTNATDASGSPRIVILPAGNVGVGTLNPIAKLDVAGNINGAHYQIGGSTVLALLPGTASLGIGLNAGTVSIADNNTFVGDSAGKTSSDAFAKNNTFIGASAGRSNISGYNNTFLGYQSGDLNSGGLRNTFLGMWAGTANDTGSDNLFVGYDAASGNTGGSGNIAIGPSASLSGPGATSELSIGNVLFGSLTAKTIGISTRNPQAALDVVATGSSQADMAQIWRDLGGVIKSSVSATGVMMAAKFVGDGSGLTGLGNVAAAGTAANLAGGALGEIPYQSGLNTTVMLAAGINGQVLQGNTLGAPSWTATPAVIGTNITSIPGANLTGAISPALISLSTVTARFDAVSAFISSFTANTDGRLLKAGDTMSGQLTLAGSTLTVTGNAFSADGARLIVNNGMVGVNGNPLNGYYYGQNNGAGALFVGGNITQRSGGTAWPMGLLVVEGTMTATATNQAFMFGAIVRPTVDLTAGYANGATGLYVASPIQVGANYAIGVNTLQLDQPAIGKDCRNALAIGTSAGCVSNSQTSYGINQGGASYNYLGSNTGIGVALPDQKLTVAGNISQTGVIISSGAGRNYFAGMVGIGTTSPAHALHISSGDASGWNPNLMVESTASGTPQLLLKSGGHQGRIATSGSNGGTYVGSDTNDFVALHSNGIERMRITADGKVGVSNWSAPSYMFHISSGAGETSTLMAVSTGGVNVFTVDGFGVNALRFTGNGSGLTGVAAADITKLPLTGGIMSGQLTNISSVTITGNGGGAYGLEVSSNVSLAGSIYSANGNVGIGTATPATRLELYNATVNEDTTIKINNQANVGYSAVLRLSNATDIDWLINVGGSGRGDYLNSSFGILENTAGHIGARLVIKQEGNVGIGTTVPSYRLHVSSGAGETGTVMAVSTGTSNIFWVAGDGAHALKYYGDGSGLAGVTDNSKLPLAGGTMTGDLNMGGKNLYAVSTITATGNITAASYQIYGSTVLTTPGSHNIFVGSMAGYYNGAGLNNTYVGYSAGVINASGNNNAVLGANAAYGTAGNVSSSTIMGANAGYYLGTGGDGNTLIGYNAGYNIRSGANNIIIGANQLASGPGTNSTAANELNIGGVLYGNLAAGTIGISTRIPQGLFDVGGGSFVVKANGNVGIGTTNPGSNLEVQALTGPSVIALTGQSVANAVTARLSLGLNTKIESGIGNTSDMGYLSFFTKASGSGIAERVRISSFGAVGIGTMDPQAALDVVSTGAAVNAYAQIWRDSGGTVVASMTATGRLSGDGSGLTNVSASNAVLRAGDIMSGSLGIYSDTSAFTKDLETNGIAISTGGAIQATGIGNGTVAGNARGNGAVELQTSRSAALQVASGVWSTISGGRNNKAYSDYATVSGGQNNTASWGAVVGGGTSNTASLTGAVVGGGNGNTASGMLSTIAGGFANQATWEYSAVGGGLYNVVTGSNSVIGGGGYNTVIGTSSVIAGGENNRTENLWSSVGGGRHNTARDAYATVAGGSNNYSGAMASTIGGGSDNNAGNSFATISGGNFNTASGQYAFVGGGYYNSAPANYTTVGGGLFNSANGYGATVAGGANASAVGQYSAVIGGNNNTAKGDYSFAAGSKSSSTANGTFTWSDSEGALLDNSSPDQVRFKARGGFLVSGSTNSVISAAVNRGVVITGGGLLGISTGSPQAALDVVSAGAAANTYAQIWRDSTGAVLSSMTSTGHLAINTITASGSLMVQKSLTTENSTLLLKTPGGALDVLELVKYGSTASGSIDGISLANLSSLSAGAQGGALMLRAVTANPMYFLTTNLERMRIDSSGHIGIGVTAPGARLEVKGETADSSKVALLATNSAGSSLLSVRNDGQINMNTSGNLIVGSAVGTEDQKLNVAGAVKLGDTGVSSTGTIRFNIASGNHFQGNNGTDWVNFDVSGGGWTTGAGTIYPGTLTDNVGIGIIPTGHKLQVLDSNTAIAQHGIYSRIYPGGALPSTGFGVAYLKSAIVGLADSNGAVTKVLGVAGYLNGSSQTDSAGVFGAADQGTTGSPATWGALGYRDAGSAEWAGYFNGQVKVYPVLNAGFANLTAMQLGGNANNNAVTNWYGLYINSPINAASVASKYALVTDQTAGNAGIGTLTPVTKLEVQSDTSTILTLNLPTAVQYSKAGLAFRMWDGAANHTNYAGIYGVLEDPTWSAGGRKGGIAFHTNSDTEFTEKLRIDSSGRVGIGTTVPGVKLEVKGTDAANILASEDILQLTKGYSGGATYPQAASFAVGKYTVADQNMPYTRLDFRLKSVADTILTTDMTAMSLQSNGNVGIGTTSPSSRLEVNGDLGLGAPGTDSNQPVVIWLQANPLGGGVTAGDVVVAGPGDRQFDKTAVQDNTAVIGVALDNVGASSWGKVAVAGVVTANCTGGAVGQHAMTSTTSGMVYANVTPPAGASVGIFLTNCGSISPGKARLLLK